MRAKDIASRLTGRMRQFRATSLGEFAVALIIFAAMGTLYLPLLLSVAPTPAFAVEAVWVGGAVEQENNWNTPQNWTVGGITSTNAPVATGDTASFNTSTFTTPTLSGPVTIASITFNPGANAYTIVNPGRSLFSFKAPGSLTILVSRKPSTTRLCCNFLGIQLPEMRRSTTRRSWVLFRIQLPEMRRSTTRLFQFFSGIQLPEMRRSTTSLT